VAIYSVNFGEASRHLENARGLLRRAHDRLKSLVRDDEVKHVETALADIDDAQCLAGKLDQGPKQFASQLGGLDAWAVSDRLTAMRLHFVSTACRRLRLDRGFAFARPRTLP